MEYTEYSIRCSVLSEADVQDNVWGYGEMFKIVDLSALPYSYIGLATIKRFSWPTLLECSPCRVASAARVLD